MLVAGIIIGMLVMYIIARRPARPETVVSHNMIVEKIESLGNLEVVKFNIQDVMEYRKNRRWLPNAKTALIVAGEVTGCVDLTLLRPEDIYTSGDSISLRLPPPQVCHVSIDHERSRVFDIEYGLWETTEIVDEAYRSAEAELRQRAREMDIDSRSRDNTVALLRPILEAMGFLHVSISFGSSGYRER